MPDIEQNIAIHFYPLYKALTMVFVTNTTPIKTFLSKLVYKKEPREDQSLGFILYTN